MKTLILVLISLALLDLLSLPAGAAPATPPPTKRFDPDRKTDEERTKALRQLEADLAAVHAKLKAYDQRKDELTEQIKKVLAGNDAAEVTRLQAELAAFEEANDALNKGEIRELERKLKVFMEGRDDTVGVSDVCPVHKVKMRVARVPIIYGMQMVSPGEPPGSVRMRDFPFAREVIYAGCILGKADAGKLYVCPDCQRAEQQWRKEHRK